MPKVASLHETGRTTVSLSDANVEGALLSVVQCECLTVTSSRGDLRTVGTMHTERAPVMLSHWNALWLYIDANESLRFLEVTVELTTRFIL